MSIGKVFLFALLLTIGWFVKPLYALQADIVIAVDTSGSMDEEAQWVQNNLNSMANILWGAGVDYRIVLISADNTEPIGICVPAPLGSGSCPTDNKLPAFLHIADSVGSADALIKILHHYPTWNNQMRPGASKSFLVVSDDDSNLSAADFIDELSKLSPPITDFIFDSIVAPNNPTSEQCLIAGPSCKSTYSCCNSPCDLFTVPLVISASIGSIYIDLSSQTSGLTYDLCTQDFVPAFKALADAVIERAKTGDTGICFPTKNSDAKVSLICL